MGRAWDRSYSLARVTQNMGNSRLGGNRSSPCEMTGLIPEFACFFKRDHSGPRLTNRFFKQRVLSFFGHQPFQMRGRRSLLDSNLDLIVNNQHFKDRLPSTHTGVPTKVASVPASQRRYSFQPFGINSESPQPHVGRNRFFNITAWTDLFYQAL
jgi:hypothetical protein